MRRYPFRLMLAVLVLAGFSLGAAPAVGAAAPARCESGDFCLFAGPHQTGAVLYKTRVVQGQDGFDNPEADDIEPPIHPLSARNPLPDEYGCIVRLDNLPDFAGEEQEIAGGDSELTGDRVASLTTDCG